MRRAFLPLGLAVLTLLALPLTGWFLLHTRLASASIQRTIDQRSRPGVMEYDAIEFGPGLLEATVLGFRLRDRTGQIVLDAARLTVELADLPQFVKNEKSHLVLNRVLAEDFFLRLEWSPLGELGLTDPFKNRAFGLGDKPSPKVDVLIDLREIVLARGRLILGWPAFGFVFDDIYASGSVRVDSDGLHISVPELKSGEGAAWIRGVAGPVQTALAALPAGPVGKTVPWTPIPYEHVTFTDFKWRKTGFETRLHLDGAGDWSINVDGSMDFSEAGIDHALQVDVVAPPSFLEQASAKRLIGLDRFSFSTKGHDLASLITFGPVSIARLDAGPVHAVDLKTPGFTLNMTGAAASVDGGLDVAVLDLGRAHLEGVSMRAQAGFGWKAFTAQKFLEILAGKPQGLIGWLTSFPLDTALTVTAPSAKVALWKRNTESVPVRDLSMEGFSAMGGLGNMRLDVGRVAATGHGSTRVAARLEAGVGFSGLTVEATLDATLDKVPLSTIRAVLPPAVDTSVLPDPTTGVVRMSGDPRDAASLKLVYPVPP